MWRKIPAAQKEHRSRTTDIYGSVTALTVRLPWRGKIRGKFLCFSRNHKSLWDTKGDYFFFKVPRWWTGFTFSKVGWRFRGIFCTLQVVIDELFPLPKPMPSPGVWASTARSPQPGAPDTDLASLAWILHSTHLAFLPLFLLGIFCPYTKCIYSFSKSVLVFPILKHFSFTKLSLILKLWVIIFSFTCPNQWCILLLGHLPYTVLCYILLSAPQLHILLNNFTEHLPCTLRTMTIYLPST